VVRHGRPCRTTNERWTAQYHQLVTGPNSLPWRPWHPAKIKDILADTTFPWYVAGGWALDLWHGRRTRDHDDVEIAVPRVYAGLVREALVADGFRIHVAIDGQTQPLGPRDTVPTAARQLRIGDGASWLADIFLEPGNGIIWESHRYPTLRAPLADVAVPTTDGIPYQVPELVLLYKAKYNRPKDAWDLEYFAPLLDRPGLRRLVGWLTRFHPTHDWLRRVEEFSTR
jgi:Aminoglycoside-2''-adenylyltransferase